MWSYWSYWHQQKTLSLGYVPHMKIVWWYEPSIGGALPGITILVCMPISVSVPGSEIPNVDSGGTKPPGNWETLEMLDES